jgi:hypothetical protein
MCTAGVTTQISVLREQFIQAIKKSHKRAMYRGLKCVWNVMAHAQKPDFVFRWNGRVRKSQFSRLLADKVCASAVVMLDTSCSEVMCRVLPTHSIRYFPLHSPFCASPCAITFQLDSTLRVAAILNIKTREYLIVLNYSIVWLYVVTNVKILHIQVLRCQFLIQLESRTHRHNYNHD